MIRRASSCNCEPAADRIRSESIFTVSQLIRSAIYTSSYPVRMMRKSAA